MKHAFTLIELLVVVTIIVILIAMLLPAMEQAIYQAELAKCEANLKAVANGTGVYALDFKRFYPYRGVLEPGITNRQPLILTVENQDDRPTMSNHIPMKALIAPLAGQHPIDAGEVPSAAYTDHT